MRAIISDLQRAVFQVADERLVAVANIVRVDNKKRRKPTFLCLTGLSISNLESLFLMQQLNFHLFIKFRTVFCQFLQFITSLQ